jgi:outer membrane receptor protein involved in Fe transport
MKKFLKSLRQRTSRTKCILLAVAIVHVSGIYAQEKQSVTGKLIEGKSKQAVPYAMSDDNGVFIVNHVISGNYRLRVSAIGYKPETKNITVESQGVTDAGIIFLQDSPISIKEVEVVGERIKARSENGSTTFYMTKKMLDVSNTGTDVLRLIPGIQVDFMQNVSLEGSSSIQILVDGKERDANFISQLDPKLIDKVEVISKSTSNIDGNATGAINIVLKKDRDSGISGQIYAEIPTSGSEIYLHPTFSLSYGFKKLNLYTSYKGDLTYLDIHENTSRKEWNYNGVNSITSNQYVRQKNWSHRFNFGLDYFLSPHDQFNLYAYYNPFSREFDGHADSRISGSVNSYWQARKEDTDINTSIFCSLYYKHNFKKEGSWLTCEISNYNLNAINSTVYFPEGSDNTVPLQTNTVKPRQNEISIKMDYTTLIGNKFSFSTGVKTKFQVLQDRNSTDFYFNENIYAAYGSIAYKQTRYDLSIGVRGEYSVSTLKNTFRNPVLSFFPNATADYKLTTRQNIQLSYSRSIKRPNIYQLNPQIAIDDPYTVCMGNPFLKPEFRSNIYLEYSIRFKSNYFASRLFYNKLTDVINNLTFINDTGAFETRVQNMGTIHQYGIQFSGTFKLGLATINPYLKIFDQYTLGNSVAKQYTVENRHQLAYESGLSAILSFKHDISLSCNFQYASPKNDIQGNYFCSALYFLSLEKTFKQKIKVGIVCAIPFTRSFTYQGAEIDGSGFSSHYEGNVNIVNPFCWFKLCYQFNSGKNREKINRSTEEIENSPKKGF